jgi:hypothetical protein
MKTYLHQPIVKMQDMSASATKHALMRVQRLERMCADLEDSLGDAQDEIEELRSQVIIMDQERDRTPAALWFFSALYNPKLPEVVNNHLQQLSAVKVVIDGKEHFDFMTLKRRLESCFLGLPTIQQFLKRYVNLQKKWSTNRAKLFLDRKLIGGDADSFFICPLCNTDTRLCQEEAEAIAPAVEQMSGLRKGTTTRAGNRLIPSPGTRSHQSRG